MLYSVRVTQGARGKNLGGLADTIGHRLAWSLPNDQGGRGGVGVGVLSVRAIGELGKWRRIYRDIKGLSSLNRHCVRIRPRL